MEEKRVIVRNATREDAEAIAQAVAMAIGDELALRNYCGEKYLAVLTEIARHKATQYSWQNALIAEVDGIVAGAIVGYDGALLKRLRDGTLNVLHKCTGHIPIIVDETEAGEYYLDSVAVFPDFRGIGVGRSLISSFCDIAYAEGHKCVGLIVDYNNPEAESLYTSLGFKRVGTKPFFNHMMWHLQRQDTAEIRIRVERSRVITPFQRRVYMELLNIPAGTTITYGELAQRIGCRSAQAIGQALKRNPFAPEVPCHRVISADGSIGGYNGKKDGDEIEHKRNLLKQERSYK